jgi:hypothetical protein
MDRLDSEDIGLIWARHYPKRSESESSKSLCVTLAMIIKHRAETIILPYGDWADKLQRALAAAGIPREQFDAVEAESKSVGINPITRSFRAI